MLTMPRAFIRTGHSLRNSLIGLKHCKTFYLCKITHNMPISGKWKLSFLILGGTRYVPWPNRHSPASNGRLRPLPQKQAMSKLLCREECVDHVASELFLCQVCEQ